MFFDTSTPLKPRNFFTMRHGLQGTAHGRIAFPVHTAPVESYSWGECPNRSPWEFLRQNLHIYFTHTKYIQMSLLRNVEEEIVAQKHLNLQSVYSILQQIMMWLQGLQCQVTGIHLAQTAKVLEVMKLAHTTDACNIARSISANATLKPKMRKEHQLAPDSDHQNTRNSCPAVHLSYSCWMS